MHKTDYSSQNSADLTAGRRLSALILIGYMGAGKSTVGRHLATTIGWEFVDLDDRVVAREKRSIAEIFRDDGEAAFREMETSSLRDALREIGTGARMVLALGGGAYVQQENALLITEARLPVVFLDASLDELRRRCEAAAGTRPLFEDEERFRALYQSRREHYLNASFRVDTTGKQIETVAGEILNFLTDLEVRMS